MVGYFNTYYFDTSEVQQSLYDYLGYSAANYSIDGIIGDLHEWALTHDCGVRSIKDVDPDTFRDILNRRELTEDNICKED